MESATKTVERFVERTGVLQLIFLVMKLADDGPISQWSWWWIYSPLWIGVPVFTCIKLWMERGSVE